MWGEEGEVQCFHIIIYFLNSYVRGTKNKILKILDFELSKGFIGFTMICFYNFVHTRELF